MIYPTVTLALSKPVPWTLVNWCAARIEFGFRHSIVQNYQVLVVRTDLKITPGDIASQFSNIFSSSAFRPDLLTCHSSRFVAGSCSGLYHFLSARSYSVKLLSIAITR